MKKVTFEKLLKCVDWEKYDLYMEKFDSDEYPNCILMPEEDYNEMERKYAEREERDKRLNETARLNNIGIINEKEGKIDDAIAAYEENIKLGYPATHAYSRLMVLYRRLKRYEDEIRVIRRTIEVYGEDNCTHLLKRLQKTQSLINKKK